MFNLKPKSIAFKKRIGSGRFGAVYPYQKCPDDDRWVVKIQNSFSHQLPQTIEEIVLGFSFNHPNVLPIKGFHMNFKEDENSWEIYTKMPRMAGTLRSRLIQNIKDKKYFSDKEVIGYFYDITCGIAYLHRRKIVHRDIKLSNILLNKNGTAVLSDVGLGKFLEDQSSSLIQEKAGALLYIAPEVLEAEDEKQLKKKALYKADIWSLGIAIAELILLKTTLVRSHLSGEQKEAELLGQLDSVRGQYHDSSLIDLVLMLLKHDPDKRITAKQLKQKLEERYGTILNIRDYLRPSQEEIPEEKKCSEINQEGGHEIEGTEQISQKMRDKMESVNKELEKTKKDLLEPGIEQLKALIREIESSEILNLDVQKLLFKFKVEPYENLAGIAIEPKDPSKITDDNVKKLIQDFTTKLSQQNCSQLTLLRIDLEKCIQITDKALAELAMEIGAKLRNLKYFWFHFGSCKKLTDKGVSHLAVQIGNSLSGLKILVILFSNCPNITDEGAQKLVSQIGNNLNTIESLSLGFENCNIKDITIREIIKYLPNTLHNLTSLRIYLGNCAGVTENTLIQLINQITINLKNLQTFYLGLEGCNVSGEMIYQLAKCLENGLKDLNDLLLYFSNCTKINNEAVLELINQISFKKIHTLKFSLYKCIQISDQTVRKIGLMIASNLETLETLQLWFKGIELESETKNILQTSLKGISELKLNF